MRVPHLSHSSPYAPPLLLGLERAVRVGRDGAEGAEAAGGSQCESGPAAARAHPRRWVRVSAFPSSVTSVPHRTLTLPSKP